MNLNESLKWRYATKKFDASKKISAEDLEYLKESIQLTATSYGLQLMKVKIVTDTALRSKLKENSWGQAQVEDASHLIVICNDKSYDEQRVDDIIAVKAETQGVPVENLEGFGNFAKKTLSAMSQENFETWTAKQCYIALGNLLAACADKEIDSCPMEGFVPAKYNELLNLDQENLNACLVIPVGYRSGEDQNASAKKVRRSAQDLFAEI